jgi:outer membrane protein assembly factor BamD
LRIHAAMIGLLALLPDPARAHDFKSVDTLTTRNRLSTVDIEAEREPTIGRYYVARRDYTGAIARFKQMLTRYPSSRHADEALALIAEAYLALGINCEAQITAAELARKFPNSRWSAVAAGAVKSAGLDPLENSRSCTSQTFK